MRLGMGVKPVAALLFFGDESYSLKVMKVMTGLDSSFNCFLSSFTREVIGSSFVILQSKM